MKFTKEYLESLKMNVEAQPKYRIFQRVLFGGEKFMITAIQFDAHLACFTYSDDGFDDRNVREDALIATDRE